MADKQHNEDELDELDGLDEEGTNLNVYIGTGHGDEEGEDIEVETYRPGQEFTILRGVRAWVKSDIEIVAHGPDGPERTDEEEDEGLLPRGRYRWNGVSIEWLGRQKGPARPPGR